MSRTEKSPVVPGVRTRSYFDRSLLNGYTCVMKLEASKSEYAAPSSWQLREAPFPRLCVYVFTKRLGKKQANARLSRLSRFVSVF